MHIHDINEGVNTTRRGNALGVALAPDTARQLVKVATVTSREAAIPCTLRSRVASWK